MRRSRLITPSQLSLFSISPVIVAWGEELKGQKLLERSKSVMSELGKQLFAEDLHHEKALLTRPGQRFCKLGGGRRARHQLPVIFYVSH